MSQHAVERAIGKLVTDPAFRAWFFANPEAATWAAGLPLSQGELQALSALSPDVLLRFCQSLDPRIVRLCVPGAQRRPRRASPGDNDFDQESAT